MSWIKDAIDSFNNSKDPFVRFIFRFILLIVCVVLVFFAYEIITGKKIHLGSGDYGVDDTTTAGAFPAVRDSGKKTAPSADTTKTAQQLKIADSVPALSLIHL